MSSYLDPMEDARVVHLLQDGTTCHDLQGNEGPTSGYNRTALPYGGYHKASKMLTFELPELSAATEEPEALPTLQVDIRSRPSFNRTPIGRVCSEDNSHIHMELEIPFDGETDDL